jgi:hypothetical protein
MKCRYIGPFDTLWIKTGRIYDCENSETRMAYYNVYDKGIEIGRYEKVLFISLALQREEKINKILND